MAAVGREQDLLAPDSPGSASSPYREAAGEELGIDDHLVLALGQRLDQPVGEAEAPLLLVVAGAVGNQVGLVGQGEEVPSQLLEPDPAAERGAVVEQLQVVPGGVGDPPAVGRRDVRPRAGATRAAPSSRRPACRSGSRAISSAIRSARIARLWRTPSPVMLRGIGKRRAASACSSAPVIGGDGGMGGETGSRDSRRRARRSPAPVRAGRCRTPDRSSARRAPRSASKNSDIG